MGLLAEERLQDTNSGRKSPMPTIPAFYGPAMSPAPAPFRFSAHQTRINWQILHGVDIDKLVRETDIDTLERCCAAMVYGDLQAEESGSLSETNFLRLFRLAQLTVEYLLHIQDRLVWENGLLKEDKARSAKHVEALHLRVKEHKEELALTKLEAKRSKKILKSAEAALMTERENAEAKAANADGKQEAELQWQLERLQRQSDELREEREGLLRDIDLLKDASEKTKERGQQDLQAAVDAASRREQAEADRRVLAAKEEALQVSQGSVDAQITAASDEMRSLRQRLADSLTRQQELETRQKLSSVLGESRTTVVAAAEDKEELERLAQRLRSAEDDAARLRAVLRDQEQLRQQNAAAKLDERSEATAEVEQLKARLEAELAERERLAQTRQDLEREAQAMRAEIHSLSRQLSSQPPDQAPPAGDRGDPEAWEENEQLREEVEEARKQRTLMEAKVKRLQSMLVSQQPQQEELIKSIHFLEHELDLARAALARPGERLRKTASMVRNQGNEPIQDRGHITAMRRSASAAPAAAAAARKPDQAPAFKYEFDPEGAPQQPSPEDLEQFNVEMAHELAGSARPGVRSRFPQPLPAFEHTRAQLEGEMEEELNKSLRSFGVDPASGRLSDAAYTAAAAQLQARRSKALAARPRSHRERAAHLHSTILWHIHRVASKIRRKGQLREDGAVGPATLQTRASQRLSLDPQATWTGRQQRASTGAARRARSSSPVRQGSSSYWERGFDSDDEGTTRFGRTLSQSLAPPPLGGNFGEAYSPLRSAIRPGSYTFKSAQDAPRESWVPASAAARPSSAEAVTRRSPTRLAKFDSAPGDFSRQRSVLEQYDMPLPRARTAAAAAFVPVMAVTDAPLYHRAPARARTAGPADDFFDAPARGGSARYAADPAGYTSPLRGSSTAADYSYDPRPQRTRTVEVRTQREEYQDDAEQLPRRSSRAEKEFVLRSEKSFTEGYKAGLEAARTFSARAASGPGRFEAEADEFPAEGALQETGRQWGSRRAGGGVRRAASSMPQGRPYDGDADLRRSRSAPRQGRVRYDDEEEEEEIFEDAPGQDARQRSGAKASAEDYGNEAVGEEEQEEEARMQVEREADAPEGELPSFQSLVQRQKSQQDMRYGAAYSPMGASSPALAQALASQTSEYSAKNAAARTTSRLRNVSVRVPKIPGGDGTEGPSANDREWGGDHQEEGNYKTQEASVSRRPITSASLPSYTNLSQQATRSHAHDLRPYSSVASQSPVKYEPNPVYEGVRTARLRMEESGSGLRHDLSNGSAHLPGSGGNDGLYDSARSVTAQQQQSFQAQVTKTLSTGISHSQETGPVRTVTAATFSNATGPVHAWAPPRAGAAVQAAGLKGYASTPSWSKPPEMASGLQGRRMATAREFYSTEHASSIKIA